MKTSRNIFALLIALFIPLALPAQQIPAKRYAPDFASANPYGLEDIDGFNFGDYEYCRWGLLQSQYFVRAIDTSAFLSFTPLTRGPFTFEGNTDLFVSTSLAAPTDWNLLQFSSGIWMPPTLKNDGIVEFSALSGKTYSLFRKFHFRDYLETKFFSQPLPANARKVIILIHGWNPDSGSYSYNDEFDALYEAIKNKIAGSDWQIVLYHWEEDADTGTSLAFDFAPVGPNATNPTEAATIAHLHGQHLGQLLGTFSQLESVHFIAHSAGAWAARSATRYLLDRTNKKVQITLLDPFIPGQMQDEQGNPNNTPLKKSLIDVLPSMDIGPSGQRSGSLYSLENIFADDRDVRHQLDPSNWDSALATDWIYSATSQTFAWTETNGINLRVDWSPGTTPPSNQAVYYDSHSGPIQFYADTVLDAGNVVPAIAGLKNAKFQLDKCGWRRSMFYNEPVVSPRAPAVQEVAGGGKTLSGGAHLRGNTVATSGIQYRWEVSTTSATAGFSPFSSAANGTNFVSSPILNLSGADVAVGKRYFRLVAKTDAGFDTGNAVQIGSDAVVVTQPPPNTAPVRPTSLIATAVSASQINLKWTDNSSNETGFKLQRRPASSSTWTDLPNASANSQAFSNTAGLSAGTTYFYRVGAVNAVNANAPAWSTEADATTFAAAGTTYTLQVDAVDLDASQILAASVGSWTGAGDAYQTKTTGFSRTFAGGLRVTVSAPPTLAGGRIFQYWLLDGVSRTYSTTASADMNGPHVFLAIYGITPPPARTPTALAIEGPSSVDESGSATYKARATYSDGTSAYVSASWDEDSSYADISSSGRLDAEAVSSDKAVTVSASYTAGGVTKNATKDITIRNTVSAQTYTLSRNVVGEGDIGYSPHATSYAAGTVVSLHANHGDGYIFDHWSGDASGTEDDITIRMDRDRTVTAHFVVDTSEGNINVLISPPQAVAEGAQWKYDNYTAWRDSGDLQDFIPTRTNRNVRFKDIPGWITPENTKASIIGGQTTIVSGAVATYREILGAVQVTIHPAQAATAGARWRMDGGPWQESSVTLADAATGNHTIEFLAIPGWATPPSQNITVARGIATTRTGEYGPPAGFPIITSVSPKTGPIEGGTVVTIEGANFQMGANVTFGGVPATSVTVVSGSKITAVVPPRPSYGTVPLALTSGGQTVTLANGFTYDSPVGTNMTLLSQVGGTVGAVAASGTMVFYGEGNSLVSADYTSITAPVVRGRLPLRGVIRDIKILGTHAIVATGGSGVHIVNIANPSSPSLVGFYDTLGSANRIALSGNLVFVADGSSIQVLDVTNRAEPTRVGAYSVSSTIWDIGVSQINGRLIALTGHTQGAHLLDVTNPAAIAPTYVLDPTAYNPTIAIDGTLVVISTSSGGAVFNISNPDAPVQVGNTGSISTGSAMIRNSILYTCSSDQVRLRSLSSLGVPPVSIPTLGSVTVDGASVGAALSGNMLLSANGRYGIAAIDVSTASAPIQRSSLNNGFGAGSVVVAGNTAFVGFGGNYSSAGPSISIPVLTAIDVSNKLAPIRGATMNSNSTLQTLVQVNTGLFGPTQNYGTRSINIQNPLAPAAGSTRSTDIAGYCGARLGQNLIIGGDNGQSPASPLLRVLDGSNVNNNTPLGTLQVSTDNGGIWSVATFGTTVFAIHANSQLRIYDYSNVSSPSLLGSVPYIVHPSGMAISDNGNFIYVSDYSNGLTVFDCTNRAAPVLVATYARNGVTSGYSVAVRGNLLAYGDSREISILDCTDPRVPTLVGAYDTPGIPYGLQFVGDDVFVADGNAGFSILRLGDINKPVIQITTPTTNTAFPTTTAQITLGGTATDLQGVVRVTWENDRGGGGVAQGTTAWSIADIQLAAGVNVLTVTAEDAQGNLARDSITVTATLPETDGPALLVTGPKPPPTFTFTTDTLPLTGTAADPSGVQSVAWANDRGGSGTATGTTAWSADILLFDGPNRITLTGRDTVGNESQTEVLVTYLSPDTTAPTVGITFPTDAQEAATTEPQVNLSGEADDDRAVSRVSWANSRGGSGEAIGERAWHINGIVLQPGVNILTITVEDAAGNTDTDTLSVTFAPVGADPARPVLAVQTPGTKPFVTESDMLACAGQASGGSAIVEVVAQLNGGPWLGVTGTANWTTAVTLTPGRNVIRFKAIDTTGRESLTTERVVTYRKLSALALTTQGEGSIVIKGNPDTDAMEVGKLYTADAKPAKGWIFAGWEGDVVSNSKRVSFVMEEGASLRAVFVENPYDELATVYRGLIRAEPLTHATSGAATLALTKSGAFTAKLTIGGKKLVLKGAFDGTGSFLGRIKASRTQSYDVTLTLDTSTPDAPVSGLIFDGTTAMALNAWPTTKFDRIAGAPQAGGYTVAIEPGATAGTPVGYGTGHMKVGKTGTVVMAVRLANGTGVAFASAITAGNRVPVYAAMDKARSSLSAPLTFADKPDSDLDGIVFWSSVREQSSKYQFAPFTSEPRIFAQRYTAPAKNERALTALDTTIGAATLTLDDGATPLTQSLTLDTDNKLTFGIPLLNGFKMTLAPKTGDFSGSILLPANGKRTTFSGVLLEKTSEGVGLLLSPDVEMAVTLGAAVP